MLGGARATLSSTGVLECLPTSPFNIALTAAAAKVHRHVQFFPFARCNTFGLGIPPTSPHFPPTSPHRPPPSPFPPFSLLRHFPRPRLCHAPLSRLHSCHRKKWRYASPQQDAGGCQALEKQPTLVLEPQSDTVRCVAPPPSRFQVSFQHRKCRKHLEHLFEAREEKLLAPLQALRPPPLPPAEDDEEAIAAIVNQAAPCPPPQQRRSTPTLAPPTTSLSAAVAPRPPPKAQAPATQSPTASRLQGLSHLHRAAGPGQCDRLNTLERSVELDSAPTSPKSGLSGLLQLQKAASPAQRGRFETLEQSALLGRLPVEYAALELLLQLQPSARHLSKLSTVVRGMQ